MPVADGAGRATDEGGNAETMRVSSGTRDGHGAVPRRDDERSSLTKSRGSEWYGSPRQIVWDPSLVAQQQCVYGRGRGLTTVIF